MYNVISGVYLNLFHFFSIYTHIYRYIYILVNYINLINLNTLIFTYDVKLFRVIKTQDTELLQNELDNFSYLGVTNKLHLNISKCNIITFF